MNNQKNKIMKYKMKNKINKNNNLKFNKLKYNKINQTNLSNLKVIHRKWNKLYIIELKRFIKCQMVLDLNYRL